MDIQVIGALHVDVVVDAPMLPRIDETLVGDRVRYVCGGKGGNQAVAAARHGVNVGMIGRVGNDEFGKKILSHLATAGVNCTSVAVSANEPSGMSVAIVDRHGDYGAVIVSAVNQGLLPGTMPLLTRARYLLLQNEIPSATNLAAAQQARQAGIEVVLNAAPWRNSDDNLLEYVDLLIVNRLEAAQALFRPVESIEDAVRAASELSNNQRDSIVTLGADGAVHCDVAGTIVHHHAFAVETVSSHGAGDVFTGALVARMVRSDDSRAAIRYASAAAALHVSTPVELRHTVVEPAVQNWLDRRDDQNRFNPDRVPPD